MFKFEMTPFKGHNPKYIYVARTVPSNTPEHAKFRRENVFPWCRAMFGMLIPGERCGYDGSSFYFSRKDDAALFKLHWC